MQIIAGVQILATIGILLFYFGRNRKQRAELWRKMSCYCGARAVEIETFESRHDAYRLEMGLTD